MIAAITAVLADFGKRHAGLTFVRDATQAAELNAALMVALDAAASD